MSMRSRSERKYTRHMDTATTWVLSGRPKLRSRGLAWFGRHNLPAPDYGRKPKRETAKPVVEKLVTLGDLPIRHVAGPCTCGCRDFDHSYKHRNLTNYAWGVISCISCGKVYRQKKRVELMDLVVLGRGERCPGCQSTTFSATGHGYGHLEDSDYEVLSCRSCGAVYRKEKPRELARFGGSRFGGGSWHESNASSGVVQGDAGWDWDSM